MTKLERHLKRERDRRRKVHQRQDRPKKETRMPEKRSARYREKRRTNRIVRQKVTTENKELRIKKRDKIGRKRKKCYETR